jgi:DNA-binding XRE family transcriptional regulator
MSNNIQPPASPLPDGIGLEAPLSRQLLLRLAQNVTLARTRAGLTQRELADAAELSRATIHLIEGGIGDPRLSTISRLAQALRVNLMDLLNNPED